MYSVKGLGFSRSIFIDIGLNFINNLFIIKFNKLELFLRTVRDTHTMRTHIINKSRTGNQPNSNGSSTTNVMQTNQGTFVNARHKNQ